MQSFSFFFFFAASVNEVVKNITATITEPNLIQVDSFSVTNVLCFGGFDGSILAYISGGTLGPNSEYQYNWYNSNGNLYPNNLSGLSNNVTNVQEGFYSISIIDDNGCSGGGQAYVGEPLDLIAVSSVTSNHNNNDISCFGYNDGSASASAFGGTPPYVLIGMDLILTLCHQGHIILR